ncbi:MAG: thiamine phosphate synthase [Anaerolineae bacterium]|nr:thiamine phosphate synthase [Gemmatimonadaceae bacterium]
MSDASAPQSDSGTEPKASLDTGAEIPRVHAVTDDTIVVRADFVERARAVMRALGARGAVHLRAHIVPAARLYTLALELAITQRESGCWLVMNDRIDIALAASARGVQLTSRSMGVADARTIALSLMLGASVHAPESAKTAEDEGADWVVAGHVFDTKSHTEGNGRGMPFIQTLLAATRLPVIAIGGVKPHHIAALRAAGVYGIAAITGIWGAENAERAATDYLSAYDTLGGTAG